MQEGQTWSLLQNASDNVDGWASSSSMIADFHKLKVGSQLRRDEALARALEDADDQEQLMILRSLQERKSILMHTPYITCYDIA